MKLIVREFIEADREALRAIFVLARDAAFSWAPAGAHQLEDFDASTNGERILVALDADEPIGFASIWEAESFLHNLFVHPLFQGRGVGKALLARCAQHFASVATLKCLKANERARQFYVAQGWTVRSEGQSADGPYLLMERASPNISCSRTADGSRGSQAF